MALWFSSLLSALHFMQLEMKIFMCMLSYVRVGKTGNMGRRHNQNGSSPPENWKLVRSRGDSESWCKIPNADHVIHRTCGSTVVCYYEPTIGSSIFGEYSNACHWFPRIAPKKYGFNRFTADFELNIFLICIFWSLAFGFNFELDSEHFEYQRIITVLIFLTRKHEISRKLKQMDWSNS